LNLRNFFFYEAKRGFSIGAEFFNYFETIDHRTGPDKTRTD